jgi:hypothetical protein
MLPISFSGFLGEEPGVAKSRNRLLALWFDR